MSELSWLIEGLALVLVLVSIYLHFWGLQVLKKYDLAGKKFQSISEDMDIMIQIYKPDLEKWKDQIDNNLEMPFSEHLFHAMFNTLVALGAKDMGKEGQAKQNMAIVGFQKIGRAIGKGLKKEIPAIETLSGMGGGGGEGGGGVGGMAEMVAGMFGIDLPPGAGNMIGNMMGGGGGSTPEEEVKKGKDGNNSTTGFV